MGLLLIYQVRTFIVKGGQYFKTMQAQRIKLSKLKNNTGQIEGLPQNPRLIKNDKFKKLVKSLQDDPEMLELRELIVYPFDGNFVVIGGNMRLKVMQELKHNDALCKVLDENTPAEKLRAYAMKDNIAYGENDWDMIANEWEVEELGEWGLDVPVFDNVDYSGKNQEIDTDFLDSKFSFKLEYSENEYTELKEKISKLGKTPEAIFYDALISL